jgi:AmmeMemoRadiSam system protein B/uncharacterized protein (TIGR00296 family)
MLRAIADGEPAAFSPELAALRDQVVAGAFICLKRGRHLRSCCGLVGKPMPLHRALEQAADRTIWEDERFPPVSPTELDHLDMEVWILHNPQCVQAQGEDRARAVTIGKHGVKVVQGPASGLFLPGVAVDHDWDARRFLDQVCVKAGLAPTAWKEDGTELFTFEGDVLRHALADCGASRPPACREGPCRAEGVPALVALCRDNLGALLIGAAPRYFGGAPDGMLAGVVLLLHRPGTREVRSFSRLSLRPGVPLHATLFSLLQSAAQYLAWQGVTPEALPSVQLGLVLLHDPVLHGTVAEPHAAGFDPARRVLLVQERGKAGLAFDRAQTFDEALEEAASQAHVTQPRAAAVYSLAALTNTTRVCVSTAPTAARGPALRPAAVAGKFYESDPEALARTVDELLAGEWQAEPWAAGLVPHAGLRYSGRITADVLRRIRVPSTVIILGPKHTSQGVEWAVAPHQTWALPGGGLASDFLLARQLCQAIPGLEMDAAAHQAEHAIEVELPLLRRLAPEVKVVGVVIGHGDLDSCRRFAEGLADVLRGLPEPPLLLVSSDMNHFANDAETRRLDALALAALVRGDPAALYETVTEHNISMCGVLPAVIVLETLRLLGRLKKTRRVGYATSADVTGDPRHVVGYAGMLFG